MLGRRLNWIEAQLHGYLVYVGAAAIVIALDLNQIAKRCSFCAVAAEQEFVMRTASTTQSQSIELQYSLQVREQYLHLLAVLA